MSSNVFVRNNVRVLVVDDELDIRLLIKSILTRDGFSVDECHDSYQAMERLRQAAYDVILLDLRMPGMSGMELYEQIKHTWASLAPRVIFITGDSSDSSTRDYLTSQKIPCIEKPFDRKTLEDKVNMVLLQ